MTPTGWLLALVGLCAVPLAAGAVWAPLADVGLLAAALLAAAAAWDAFRSPTPAAVAVEREAAEVFSVGAPNPVTLHLTNRGPAAIRVEVEDSPPTPSAVEGLPATVDLPPGRTGAVVYHVTPHLRGPRAFGRTFLRSRTNWGLWERHARVREDHTVRVYPNVRAVRGAELLARQNRRTEGVRASRQRGRGREFDRLREYVRGDEVRQIDWKATARTGDLVSREYTVERNQSLLLLLDSGRSMCNAEGGVTHFDRALNAAVLLAHVALGQGDTAALLAAGAETRRWVPPVRGAAGVRTLVRQTYDLAPRYEASDYGAMVREVRTWHRRRSLVVLLTHATDDVQLAEIARHVRPLRSPHLVLVALLENSPLAERAAAVPAEGAAGDRDAFRIAAAAELRARQRRRAAALAADGVLVVEATPENLSAAVVSRYLEVKAKHLL
ncbi:DUF58 domain-containing protein [Alienimonas californiensis]|uniref:DUF58 domain-containing protein n=1 Tax=Alienimonas californiensis TaxID=2527989 RepID=A0A517P906_9PLAN|nr:DUF58 domain-containing protein [Alienimonas californiensis]QDT15860.1 hypothetical protein CA12_19550 [Alienimonas californiensis]